MAIDPNIKKKADDIRNKIYGKEVRESLASGLEEMSSDVVETVGRQDEVEGQFQSVIENTTDKDVISAPEIIAARNGEANLKDRIDKDHQEVTAQLAQIETNGVKLGEDPHYGYFSTTKERTTIDYHAFEDLGQLNTTDSGLGYASFDAKPTMNNALDQDHLVGYQARPRYMGDGDLISYMHGYDTDMEHSGSGTIEKASGMHIRNVKGTGQINKNYGLFISPITKGLEKYQIYSEGSAPSYFKGNIHSDSNIEALSFLSNLTYGANRWEYNQGGYGGFGFTPTADTMDLIYAVKNLGTKGEPAITKKVAHIDYQTGSFVIDEKIGIGVVPDVKMDIDDKYIRVRQNYTPPSSTGPGIKGLIAYDSDYMYVCVEDNVWKRSALTSW